MSLVDEFEDALAPVESVDLHASVRDAERLVHEVRKLAAMDRSTTPNRPFHALELRIEGHTYLLPVDPLREIVPATEPTSIADAPSWVAGSFRYGPLLLPMIDLARKLTGRPTTRGSGVAVFVLHRPRWTGILAPLPSGSRRIDLADVEPPSADVSHSGWVRASLSRRDEGTAHLLSIERLARDYVLGVP